jgi:hypothetical protein
MNMPYAANALALVCPALMPGCLTSCEPKLGPGSPVPGKFRFYSAINCTSLRTVSFPTAALYP